MTVFVAAAGVIIDGELAGQARRTFGMSRRVVVGMARYFGTQARRAEPDHNLFAGMAQLRATLAKKGVGLKEELDADQDLIVWLGTYEPYVSALSGHLLMPLPVWETAAESPVGRAGSRGSSDPSAEALWTSRQSASPPSRSRFCSSGFPYSEAGQASVGSLY